jgi:hypothetical protein
MPAIRVIRRRSLAHPDRHLYLLLTGDAQEVVELTLQVGHLRVLLEHLAVGVQEESELRSRQADPGVRAACPDPVRRV